MAKKFFVLRTGSLVSKEGYSSLLSFGTDNEIVIPFPVIDELEKLTHQYSQKAKNARAILDYLANFDIKKLMSKNGVRQNNNSTLRLVNDFNDVKVPLDNLSKFDLRCLQIAKGLYQESGGKNEVILVTKNSSLRLKANSIGIKAQDFKDDIFPTLNEQYKGRIDCQTSKIKIDKFYKDGHLTIKDIIDYSSIEWVQNLFLVITAVDDENSSVVARYAGNNKIVQLQNQNAYPFGICTKNVGQEMLKEALLAPPDVAPLIIIKGGPGTGKTYLSLAAALERTIKQNPIYSQILISTPMATVGQERIGFLPGDIDQKYNPHLGGVHDNLKLLIKNSGNEKSKSSTHPEKYYFEKGIIQIQPIGFLRGRTIVDTFYIIDETQNVDPDDIKTIVSRAGQGSKFVFLGDPSQIDNPSLNERFNGLVYLSERMKGNPLVWQITLEDEESVRSPLAKIAAKTL